MIMKKPANLLLAFVMTLLSLPSVAHTVCNPAEAEAGLVYPHVFAPSEGFVNRTESDFRHEEIPLKYSIKIKDC